MNCKCPNCANAISLTGAKPGRYGPTCPKCRQRFVIMVIDGDPPTAKVGKWPVEAPAPATEKTAGAASPEPRAKPAPLAPRKSVSQTSRPASDTTATRAPASAVDQSGTMTMSPPQAARATAARRSDETADFVDGSSGGAATTGVPKPKHDHTAATGNGSVADDKDFSFADAEASTTSAASTGAGSASDADFSIADQTTKKPNAAEMPAQLGGYRVMKELGRGGMGAVYLARQISLDRPVAVKVMRPEWSRNPVHLARFAREAFAAAQLVHHNIVQIYDIGIDHEMPFFSMEFVDGESLQQLLRRDGKLDIELAVGYILQAARGLEMAHEQGMIHRDIKPDNLMLNRHGVVKVADLGIVKTPEKELENGPSEPTTSAASGTRSAAKTSPRITTVGAAMGTPQYMAPEQAHDAAGVDGRADIYSLGCSLYLLVTGRPVFEGKTVAELFAKHKSQPVVPPDEIVQRVPKTLSTIILKMVAKRPEDRFQSMAEVIQALEHFLGIESTKGFTPREEHATKLEQCVRRFNVAPPAKLRAPIGWGFLAACPAVIALCLLAGWPRTAGAALALFVLAPLCYFVVEGVWRNSFAFAKVRQYVFGCRWVDWLKAVAGALLFCALLSAVGQFWTWIGLLLASAGLACGYFFAVDRRLAAARRGPIDEIQDMLRSMRLRGLEEDALRQFVCKYSGPVWEEFFESLFGYEAKLSARDRWGRSESGQMRAKFAPWRDGVIRWVDARRQAREEALQRKLLEKVEAKSLEAQGVGAEDAAKKAREQTEKLLEKAAETRHRVEQAARPTKTPPKPRKPLEADRSGGGVLQLLFGSTSRFLIGGALLAGFLMWMQQNQLLDAARYERLKQEALTVAQQDNLDKAMDRLSSSVDATKASAVELSKEAAAAMKPLELPLVPLDVSRWFGGLPAGAAGLLLLISSLFGGARMGLLMYPAAAVAVVGPMFAIPSVAGLDPQWISLAGAGILGVVALLFGRRSR